MDYYNLKRKLRGLILQHIDMSREISDKEVLSLIDQFILSSSKEQYISLKDKSKLKIELFNSLRRFDILQELLEDGTITEIMVNGANEIFYERDGQIFRWDKQFESEEKLNDIIQRIVSQSNRIVNESSPIVDARLTDGSRVNVVLSPIAIGGSTLTIRKFGNYIFTMERLIECGAITKEVAEILGKLIKAKYNIFISGGTGSGKTTFLNVLSNYIPEDERIITIEDSAELQIQKIPNLVRLEVRNENVEGKNGVSIRDLIKASLRMRPDRIIVGEVRDEAAIDMLNAMNTGHDGSMSTGHANSPQDMLARLETLVLLGTDIPLMSIRKQIASAIDIIVHLGRLRDKTRKILEVAEVLGCVNNEIQLKTLYRFVEKGEDENGKVLGRLEKTDATLQFQEKLKRAGINI